jgi:hypothetical protein
MGVAQHFGLVPGLVMIFFCFVTGEFTFVASIAFASSGAIVTESVGTLMGLFFCSFNVGAMMSAFSVTPIYDRFGMAGSAAASATAMLTGTLMLRYALRGCGGGGCGGDVAHAAAAAAVVAPAVGAEKEQPPTVLVDEKVQVAAIDGAASEAK